MAVNYVNSGERITYTVPEGGKAISGSVITLCGKCFVALSAGAEGDEITLSRYGRFTLAKGKQHIHQAQTVYWDLREDHIVCTHEQDLTIPIGITAAQADEGDKTVDVILITNV